MRLVGGCWVSGVFGAGTVERHLRVRDASGRTTTHSVLPVQAWLPAPSAAGTTEKKT